jgi:hypothetical protein
VIRWCIEIEALDAISSFPLALTKNSWVEARAKLERGIATVQKCCTLGERWRKICFPVSSHAFNPTVPARVETLIGKSD